MAHFAQLDDDNTVLCVIVVSNESIIDPESGEESEELGIDFCKSLLGEGTRWVQTSYNNSFRKRYAAVGGIYNPEHDVFISPAPFPSWSYDFNSHEWEPPVPMPDDGMPWFWDESTGSWSLPPIPPEEELTDSELKALSEQIAQALKSQF